MRTRTGISLLAALVGGFLTTPIFAAVKGLEVLISADAIPSPEGYRPKPGKPIYYLLFQSRETLGEAVGGVKLPAPELVERAVVAELAKQGFVRAVEGGPLPDIAIFAVLGDSNFKIEFSPKGNPYLDGDFRMYMDAVNVRQVVIGLGLWGMVPETVEGLFPDLPEKTDIYPSKNSQIADAQEAVINEALKIRNRDPARKRNAIKTLVGAKKVERAVADRTLGGVEAERIAMTVFEDQYYLSLSAVEAKKRPDGGRAFLWRTTMIIDWRVDFSKALPEMLAQAGPVFGTDLAVPGFVNTAKQRDAQVEVGEATVVKEKDASAPAPAKKE